MESLTGDRMECIMSVSNGTIDRRHMSAREHHMLDIAVSVRDRIAGDCDVSGYAYEVSNAVSDLLAACDIRKVKNPDAYTQALVQMYIVFVAGDEIGIGGSLIDYCAWHCVDALNGYKIRLRDGGERADAIRKSMRTAIAEHALEPQRELDLLADAGVVL